MNNDGTWAATMTINFNTPVKFHTSEADTLQDIVVYRAAGTSNTKGAASVKGSGIDISGSTVKVYFLPPAEDNLRLMGGTTRHLYISGTALKSVDTSTDLAQVGSMSPSGAGSIQSTQSDNTPPKVASARLDRDSRIMYIVADESLGYGTYKTSSDDETFPTTLNSTGETVNSNATKFHLRDGPSASSGGVTMAVSNNPSTHGSPIHEIRFTLTPTQLSTVTGYANPYLYVDVKAFSGIEDAVYPLAKEDNVAHNKQLDYLPRITAAALSETARVLTLTFDEQVTKGSGTFYIRNSATGSYTASTDVSGTLSSVSGTAGTATLSASDLTKVQNMATPHLHLNAEAVAGSGGAPNAKKAVALTLTSEPVLSGATIDRATGAVTLTFDKAVTKSTGNIDIREGSSAAHSSSRDVRIPASDASVSASGSAVAFTISSANLAKVNAMASPHLYLAASAVVDSSSTPNDALTAGQDIVLSPRFASASLVPATRALSATFSESVSAPASSPGNVYVASAGDADGFTSGTDVQLPLSGTSATHSATITAAELARVLAMTNPKLYAEANAATVSGLANAAHSTDLAITAPVVSSAAVDIGTGAVTLTFSYSVSAGAGSMDITQSSSAVYDPSTHVRVPVSDTTVSANQLAFTLSEPDRKKAIAMGATLWARIPAGLVSGGAGGDLSAVSYLFARTADTTAPTLVASGATRPALDEETGILTLTFSESVKEGADVDLTKIFIADGSFSTGGTALSASGAASAVTSTADTDAQITVKLTEELRKAAIGYGTPHVRLAQGAVKDLSDQDIASAASTEINDLADAVAPALVASGANRPALDEETGVLTLTFSESVKDGADVDLTKIFIANDPFSTGGTALTGSTVTSTEDTDAEITIDLTEILRKSAIGYAVPHVRLDAGAVKDLSNQDIASAASTEINDLADTTAPTLVASGANGPALDEETGILTLTFSESVKDSDVDLAQIFINDGAFTSGGTALTGSAVTSTVDTDAEIAIDLTEILRKAAIGYTTPHVRLDAGAVKDLSNQGVAASGAEITDTADTTAPGLSSTAPVFHTPTGVLTVVFDESVKDGQANVDLAKIFISNNTSVSGGTALTGSAVSSTDDTDAEISITVPETLRLQVAAQTYMPYLRFDAGAVSDLSNQNIAASTVGTAIRKVTDTDPPQVSSAALNEETGLLTVTFDETVDVSSAANEGSSFALREGAGASAGSAGEVVLSDAEIKAGQSDGPTLEFELSESSRRDAIALADPHLYVAAGAIEDVALNGIGEPRGGPAFTTVVDVSQTLDTNAPALETTGSGRPALDEGTGVLTLTFGESVKDGSADLAKIFINDGPFASGGTPLTGSAVTSAEETDARITIELTEALRQSAIGYAVPHVRIAQGAVADLSGQGAAPAGAEIDDSSDLAPPEMTAAFADATRRVLILVFDEYVRAGPSGSASLVSGGVATTLADTTPRSLEDRTRISYDLSLAELGIAVGSGARASIGAGSGVSDTSGNPARASAADLVVTDDTAPQFVSATIISDSVVRAVFDDILAAPSASDFAVSGHAIASVSLGADGSTVNITIAGAFTEGRSVQVTAGAGVQDMFGNSLAPTTLTAEYEPIRVAVRALTVSSDNAARNASNASDAERGLVRPGDTVTLRLEADPSGARIAQAYLQISSSSAAASVDGLALSASLRVPAGVSDGPLQFAIRITDEFGLPAALGPEDLTGANVAVDATPPAAVSASASGIDSVTVRYSERVAVDHSGATVTVGSATYSVSVSGSGSETVLVYWDGAGSVPASAVLRGLAVHDMAGNAGSDGPLGAGPSVGSASPGPTGVMPIAKGTTLRTVTAPAGIEPALELSSVSATDPRVAFAGGRAAAFENPLSIITQEPGLPDLFFQAGTEVGGLAGLTVAEVGLEAAVVVAPSEYEVPAGSPALDAYPGLYNPATAVLVGSPVSDIAFSKPVRMEFDIPLSGLVFSVDAAGSVLPIPACAEGYEGAVPLLQEAPDDWPAETYDPLACVSENSVWTLHFSVFGVAHPRSGGSECDDCTPPTLGYDSYGARLVDGGFAYNGLASDVQYFFTPYPLIESEVGKENTVSLKIYENEGPGNIERVSLAFGLRSGEVISESRAVINYDVAFDGTGSVSVIDPDGAIDLEALSASHDTVECSAGSSLECLSVTITHAFRAPLEFDIVGTDVWDRERNSWQNYYNHGIRVSGEPMDPQPGIPVNGGDLVLYQISSNADVMIDADGHLFKLSPEGDYVPLSNQSRLYHDIDESMYVYDGIPKQGYDRSDPQFRDYLRAQVLAAQQILDSMMPPAEAGEPAAEPAEPGRGAAEERLREAVLAEQARAALLFEELFGYQHINGQD